MHPTNRRLAELMARMSADGYRTLRAQAIRLGLPVGALRNYAAGFPLPADVARDIEWVMELSDSWLDGPATAVTVVLDDNTKGLDGVQLPVQPNSVNALCSRAFPRHAPSSSAHR
jgi:hypothetical protein